MFQNSSISGVIKSVPSPGNGNGVNGRPAWVLGSETGSETIDHLIKTY